MAFCPYCGKEIDLENTRFCSYCGKTIKADTSESNSVTPSKTKGKAVLIISLVSIALLAALVIIISPWKWISNISSGSASKIYSSGSFLMTEDDKNIYYAVYDFDGSGDDDYYESFLKIEKISKKGSKEPKTVITHLGFEINQIVYHNGYLYFVADYEYIYRINANLSDIDPFKMTEEELENLDISDIEISDSIDWDGVRLFADNDDLYVIANYYEDYGSSIKDYKYVYRFNENLGRLDYINTLDFIHSAPSLFVYDDKLHVIVAEESDGYYDHIIYAVDVNTGERARSVNSHDAEEDGGSAALYDGRLYAIEYVYDPSEDALIFSKNIDGGDKYSIANYLFSYDCFGGFYINNNKVYYSRYADEEFSDEKIDLYRCNLDGSSHEKILSEVYIFGSAGEWLQYIDTNYTVYLYNVSSGESIEIGYFYY